MNIADYNGVWVFAEQRGGELQKVSLEILGEGRKIADKLGVKLTALLLGDNVKALAEELGTHGADEVLVAESELLKNYTTDGYTKVICDLASERKPGILFIGATFIGRDLGPRVAARLSTGLTADCTILDVEMENGALLATRPAFGGNLMATIACPDHRPQM
ncbi:MAG: electron transfer flavoprotein subunit alpha/FixB family protein, partial [Cetobacterium sp.]